MPKCKGITIAGKKCHRKATNGELCWQHKNTYFPKSPSKKTKVVVVDGYIGCGKTTLCNEMADLGFVARDLDYYTQPFIKAVSSHEISKDDVEKEWTKMQGRVDAFIRKHKSVLFCGATALRIYNVPHLLKFPRGSKIFWLKVSQKQSVQQALHRDPRLCGDRKERMERSMKFQLAAFKTRKTGRQLGKKTIINEIKKYL